MLGGSRGFCTYVFKGDNWDYYMGYQPTFSVPQTLQVVFRFEV